jgi:hypothetical protein
VQCSKCGTEVSVLREFCPQCGTSTAAGMRERGFGPPGGRPVEELQRNRKTVFVIGAGILILLGVAGKMQPFGRHLSLSPGVIKIDTRSEPRKAITIAASELFEAYHKDSQAADRRFGGREMVVSGDFVRTVPDGYGSIDMRLKTEHPDLPLGIDLDNHSVDAATKLEPGQMVTVSCQRVAGTGDDPWLQDCVIQPPAEGRAARAAPPSPPPPPAPAASESNGG